MNVLHKQALDLAVIWVCALLVVLLTPQTSARVKAFAWSCVLSGLATLGLCLVLTSCSAVPLRSAEVQIAGYRAEAFEAGAWSVFSEGPTPAGVRAHPVAHCSGFALATPAGVRIVTAAHCIHEPLTIGDKVPIVTKDRYEHTTEGVRWAVVAVLDRDQDLAELTPEAAALPELAPLQLAARAPYVGEPVWSVAGQKGWALADGQIQEKYYPGEGRPARWGTTQDIQPGWSGAPVVGPDGVLGYITSCDGWTLAAGLGVNKGCYPASARFVELSRP